MTPSDDASLGLRRRAAARQIEQEKALGEAPVQAPMHDPYAGNWAAETGRSVAARTAGWAPALSVLGHSLTGNEEGVQRAARRFQEREQQARELGPQIQSFEDAADAGGGVGDYAAALGYQAASLAPDLVGSVTGAGLAATGARAVAKRAARRSVADAIENRAANVAARDAATQAATRQAALAAPDGAAAVSNAMRVARAQVTESSRKAALQQAAAITGRTPRIQGRINAATQAGVVAGATAGQFPGLNTENVDVLANGGHGQEGAVKALAGTTAAAAIGSLPVSRFFGRFGNEAGEQIAREADGFRRRFAKEFAKQGMAEGSAEATQAATQLATHKWMGENIDLVGPEALNTYLTSFAAGGILGGALGGAGEVGRTGARALGDAGRVTVRTAEQVRDLVRENLSKFGGAVRARREARAGEGASRAGEPVGEAQGGIGELYRKAKAAVDRFAESPAVDGAKQRGKSILERFGIEVDDMVDDVFSDTPTGTAPEGPNPLQFKSKVQSALMQHVNREHPIWQDPGKAQMTAAALERLFRGSRLSGRDIDVIDELGSDPTSGINEATIRKWAGLGPLMMQGRRTDGLSSTMGEGDGPQMSAPRGAAQQAEDAGSEIAAQRTLQDAAAENTGDGAMASAMRNALADVDTEADARFQSDAEGDIVNDALSEREIAAERPLDTSDRLAGLSRDIEILRERARGGDAEARAQLAETGRQFAETRRQLQTELKGPPTDKNPHGKNIFIRNNKHPEPYIKAVNQPGRVELVERAEHRLNNGKVLQVKQALSVDSLAAQELARNSEAYQNLPEAQRGKAALVKVLGDIANAGMAVNPRSITAGDLGTVGGIYMGTLTKADVRDLRRIVAERNPTPEGQKASRMSAAQRRAERQSDEYQSELDRDQLIFNQEMESAEPEAASERERRVLAPRNEPTGARNSEGRYTPTEALVTDANVGVDAEGRPTARVTERRGDPEQIDRQALREERAESRERYDQADGTLREGPQVDARPAGPPVGTAAAPSARAVRMALRNETVDTLNQAYKGKRKFRRLPADLANRVHAAVQRIHTALGEAATRAVDAYAQVSKGVSGTTAYNVNGQVVVAIGPGKPVAAVGDRNRMDRTTRILAHESTHALDYRNAAEDGTRPSDNPAFAPGGLVHNEVLAAIDADPILAEWFGYTVDPEYKGRPHREIFAQLGALKVRFPEKLDAHFPNGKAILEAVLAGRAPDAGGRAPVAGRAEPEAAPSAADGQGRADPPAARAELTPEQARERIAELGRIVRAGDDSDGTAAGEIEQLKERLQPAKKKAAKKATKKVAKKTARPAEPEAQEAPRDEWQEWKDFFHKVLKPDERSIIDRVLRRPENMRILREAFADQPEILRGLDDANEGMELRAALGFRLWQEGAIKLGFRGDGVMDSIGQSIQNLANVASEADLAHRLFTDMASGKIERWRKRNVEYNVRRIEARSRGILQRAANWASEPGPIGEAMSKFWSSQYQRLHDSGIPAFRELAAALRRPQGTTGEDRGMTPMVTTNVARFMRRAQAPMRELSTKERVTAIDILQRQLTREDAPQVLGESRTKVWAAVEQTRKLFDDMYDYMVEAGVDVGHRENFFPVVFEPNNPRARTILTELYSQEKFHAPIREALGAKKNEPIEPLIRRMVDGAFEDGPKVDAEGGTPGAPNFRALNYRISQFVYEYGDAADIKRFASVQSKDLAAIMGRYIEPMVKHAEYTRRLGGGEKNSDKLDAILARAKEQGATEAQLTEARNMVKASLGTYGADGSPVLNAISPALAKKLSGPKSKAFVQGVQAYQNVRLLPLAIMSSLVDPMGIAVRTGGDFKTAWDGFKTGIATMTNGARREEMMEMLSRLGAADDMMTMEALNAGFGGGDGSRFARKLNEFTFKANGMQSWVRTTRFMALQAGHGFLLKHAGGKGTSGRYLAELGLRQGDIQSETVQRSNGTRQQMVKLLTPEQYEQASAAEKARDDRVRNALMQFVDEAILRPDSQQAPLWHKDPYMGVVVQYKAFAYAIYDQIGGRIARELREGNPAVLLAAMAYVPVIIMSELLRGLIQTFGEGQPDYRSGWGPGEYLWLGVERTGFLGPKFEVVSDTKEDLERNRLPGASQAGPAARQANDIKAALAGRRDGGKTFEDALPGSALWKRWNDDLGGKEAARQSAGYKAEMADIERRAARIRANGGEDPTVGYVAVSASGRSY